MSKKKTKDSTDSADVPKKVSKKKTKDSKNTTDIADIADIKNTEHAPTVLANLPFDILGMRKNDLLDISDIDKITYHLMEKVD